MEQSQQLSVNELKDSTDKIYQSTSGSKNSSESTSPSDIRENSDESQENRIGIMKTIKKVPFIKKRYDKITDEQREKLIDAVENKNEKIKHVAKRLGINYSSAKSICQVFKSEGRTSRKTCKKRGQKGGLQQESEECVISPEITNTRYQTVDPPGQILNANFKKELDQIKPEKDSLEILRDRLLQSRVSKSTTNTTNSPQFMSLRQENENKQVEVKPSLINQSSIQAFPQASSYVVITEDQLRNLQALNNQGQNLCSYPQIVPGNALNTHLSYNSQNTNLYNPQIIQNGFIIQNVALNQPQNNFLKLAENNQNYQSVSNINLPLNQQLLSSLYANSDYQLSSQLDINRIQTISQSFPQVLSQQQKVLPLLYENKSNLVFTQPLINNMLESKGEKFIYLNQAIDQTKFYLA